MNELQVGDQLDHYRIEALAAQSGMACIYRAVDLHNGMPVAIKVPHFQVESDPVLFDRFRREDAIGRRLDHPRVMKVLPDDDRSRLYMVMEWLDGRLLRRVLTEEKKLAPERAIRIALGVCEGLEYIHGQSVVHRDLKPENIMVDSEDRIKLIDFGIANKAGAKRLTYARITQSMGTPDYVSPEQVKLHRGDARSDLYALGVILYEMLTGEVPFQGSNPLVVLNDRLVNNPIPPREIDPANLRSDAGDYLPRAGTQSDKPLCERPRLCARPAGSGFGRRNGTPRRERLARAPFGQTKKGAVLCGARSDSHRHCVITSHHRSTPLETPQTARFGGPAAGARLRVPIVAKMHAMAGSARLETHSESLESSFRKRWALAAAYSLRWAWSPRSPLSVFA